MTRQNLNVVTTLPENKLLRIYQIVGRPAVSQEEAEKNRRDAEMDKKSGRKPNKKPKRARDAVPPIIPISRSQLWAWVNCGKFPAPIKLGPRTTVWLDSLVQDYIEQHSNKGGAK